MRTQSVSGIAPNCLLPAMSGATSVRNVPLSGLHRQPSLAATVRRAELSALDDGVQEAMDASKAAQAAQTGIDEIAIVLKEAVSVAESAANDGLTAEDREKLQGSLHDVGAALDNIVQNTGYGGKKLLDGSVDAASAAGGLTCRPLAEGGPGPRVAIDDLSAKALSLENLDLSTAQGAEEAAGALKLALEKVQAQRADVAQFSANMDSVITTALCVRNGAADPTGELSLDLEDGHSLLATSGVHMRLQLAGAQTDAHVVSRLLG